MKTISIDYEKLRSGDLVLCGGRGFVSSVIRFVTGGSNDKNIATHVGIIIDVWGQKLIAEMKAGGLEINSLNEYVGKRRRFIIGIRRVEELSKKQREYIQRRIAWNFRKGLEYDWSGDVSFIFSQIQENPNRFYCSEYVAYLLKLAGFKISQDTQVSPNDFQTNRIVNSVLVEGAVTNEN